MHLRTPPVLFIAVYRDRRVINYAHLSYNTIILRQHLLSGLPVEVDRTDHAYASTLSLPSDGGIIPSVHVQLRRELRIRPNHIFRRSDRGETVHLAFLLFFLERFQGLRSHWLEVDMVLLGEHLL
jgi:hypothetical protein